MQGSFCIFNIKTVNRFVCSGHVISRGAVARGMKEPEANSSVSNSVFPDVFDHLSVNLRMFPFRCGSGSFCDEDGSGGVGGVFFFWTNKDFSGVRRS